MNRKILYILTAAALTVSAFVAGRVTSQAEQPETLTRVEMTAESGGLYLSYMDDQDKTYNLWIPSADLENAGFLNLRSVKGWEAWETAKEVGLEIGGYEITKEPYTVNATVEKID